MPRKPPHQRGPAPKPYHNATPPPTVKRLGFHLAPSPLALAFRHLKPNWRHYIDYADTAARQGDKEMVKYLHSFSMLPPRERTSISPEQLCEMSGVTTKDLFAAVAGQLWEQSRMEATMIIAAAHPRVIEKTAKAAQTLKGVRDREMFHKHTGFLPTHTGPAVVVHNTPQTLISGGSPLRLPSMEEDMLEIEDADEPLSLPPPSGLNSSQEE